MKALKRVLKLMSQYPKVFLAILVIGFIVHMVGPDCLVTSSDSNDIVNGGNYTVDAKGQSGTLYGQWMDTGLSVSPVDRLSITTSNTVFLCPVEQQTATWQMNANSFNWVSLGIPVIGGNGTTTGDMVKIQLGATSTSTSKRACNGGKQPSDNMVAVGTSGSNCFFSEGNMLSAAIIPEGSNPNNATYKNPNNIGQSFPGVTSVELKKGITSTAWGTSNASSTVTTYGGYDGRVNKSGIIWVRVTDTIDSGDNQGGYTGTITVDHTDGCMANDGKTSATQGYTSYGNIQAVVAKSNPATTTNYAVIPMTNGAYNPDDRGEYAPATGNIWLRVNDVNPSDNSGSYTVNIKATHARPQKAVLSAALMDMFVNPVRNTLNHAVPSIYTKLIQDTNFIKSIRAALGIYVILYCIMYTVGLMHVNQVDLVIRIFKIGTVLTLISPGSWDFFNDHLFSAFTEGGFWLLNVMTGGFGTTDNPFRFIDRTLGIIFREDTILKLLALAMTLPLGLVYILLVASSLLTYIGAIVRCLTGFLMSFIAVALLLTMAPFFISFILFQDTKELFTKWVSLLFRYSIEPVIVMVGLTVINEILAITLQGIINMSVCWKCAVGFSIPGYGDLFCIEFWMPWGYDNDGNGYNIMETGLKLFTDILIFEMLTSLLKDYVEFAPRIAAKITTTSPVTGTNFFGSGSVSDAAEKGLVETAKMAVGKDDKSVARRDRQKGIDKEAAERLSTGAGEDD